MLFFGIAAASPAPILSFCLCMQRRGGKSGIPGSNYMWQICGRKRGRNRKKSPTSLVRSARVFLWNAGFLLYVHQDGQSKG